MRKLWCVLLGLLPLELAVAGPLRLEPNLLNIHFSEITTTITDYTFAANSTAMTTQIANLNVSGFDFESNAGERYDVFYSNASGVFDSDGDHITIVSPFLGTGAFNITNLLLEFNGIGLVRMDTLASFSAGFGGSQVNAVDANPNSFTAADGSVNEGLLSLTLGLSQVPSQSQTPEPATFGLAGAALAGLVWRNRRRQ